MYKQSWSLDLKNNLRLISTPDLSATLNFAGTIFETKETILEFFFFLLNVLDFKGDYVKPYTAKPSQCQNTYCEENYTTTADCELKQTTNTMFNDYSLPNCNLEPKFA